jgi:hypothetical protein
LLCLQTHKCPTLLKQLWVLPTLSIVPESNFGLDELQDLGGGGTWVKLDGVELPVHEVKPGQKIIKKLRH